MSFQQGLSGLHATSKDLEVIGNNIANANTFGAKAARAEFGDMFAAALNGAGMSSIGIGVNMQTVAQQFTQGNITTTDNPMDLAINGEGFFQVTDSFNSVSYTRNGQFKVDREGYIVNNTFQRLMGYPANGNGVSCARARPGRCSCRPAASRPRPRAPFGSSSTSTRATRSPRPRPAPPIDLQRPHHLQQRDLGDRVRRQGPGSGADLLLPEVGHRHLERVHHRQRHPDPGHGRRAVAAKRP